MFLKDLSHHQTWFAAYLSDKCPVFFKPLLILALLWGMGRNGLSFTLQMFLSIFCRWHFEKTPLFYPFIQSKQTLNNSPSSPTSKLQVSVCNVRSLTSRVVDLYLSYLLAYTWLLCLSSFTYNKTVFLLLRVSPCPEVNSASCQQPAGQWLWGTGSFQSFLPAWWL